MNRREAAIRNSALVSRKISDETIMWKDLAAEFHVSVMTARRIWKDHEEDLKRFFVEDTADYLLTVAQKTQSYAQLRTELWKTAIGARARGNHAAAVGAFKAIAELHSREVTLMQQTGLIPKDLGVVRVQLDVRKVSAEFISIFHKYMPAGVADVAEQELLDVLRPGLSRQTLAAEVVAVELVADVEP